MRKLTWHSEYNLSLSAFCILPHREGLESQLNVWQLQQASCIDSCKSIFCKQPQRQFRRAHAAYSFQFSLVSVSFALLVIYWLDQLACFAISSPLQVHESQVILTLTSALLFLQHFSLLLFVVVRCLSLCVAKGFKPTAVECQRQRQKLLRAAFCRYF